MPDGLLGGLVPRTINQQEGVVLPVSIVSRQLSRELRYEDAEHLVVGVNLSHRAVKLAGRADCHLHRNPRAHLGLGARVHLAPHSPFSPIEVGLIEPCLI